MPSGDPRFCKVGSYWRKLLRRSWPNAERTPPQHYAVTVIGADCKPLSTRWLGKDEWGASEPIIHDAISEYQRGLDQTARTALAMLSQSHFERHYFATYPARGRWHVYHDGGARAFLESIGAPPSEVSACRNLEIYSLHDGLVHRVDWIMAMRDWRARASGQKKAVGAIKEAAGELKSAAESLAKAIEKAEHLQEDLTPMTMESQGTTAYGNREYNGLPESSVRKNRTFAFVPNAPLFDLWEVLFTPIESNVPHFDRGGRLRLPTPLGMPAMLRDFAQRAGHVASYRPPRNFRGSGRDTDDSIEWAVRELARTFDEYSGWWRRDFMLSQYREARWRFLRFAREKAFRTTTDSTLKKYLPEIPASIRNEIAANLPAPRRRKSTSAR